MLESVHCNLLFYMRTSGIAGFREGQNSCLFSSHAINYPAQPPYRQAISLGFMKESHNVAS